MTATKELTIKITKQELLNYSVSALKEFIEEMNYPTGRDEAMTILTIISFTSILSNMIFPEEKKGE